MHAISSPHAAPAPSSCTQSEAKRRRLRKGTHSCWECKRRKMKCIFDSRTDVTTCNACLRRGSHCVSQEFPEEISLSASDGVAALESLNSGSDGGTTTYGCRTPTTTNEDDDRADFAISTSAPTNLEASLAYYKTSENCNFKNTSVQSATYSTSQGECKRLSRFLYQSLPSREDTEKICRASRHPSVLSHKMMTIPYSTLNQNGLKTPESLLEIPEPDAHPVLIARHMLLLATFLQHLHPDLHKEIKGLSELPRAIMERLAYLAIKFVTTNDELIGSIEGLEVVMIESVYQANIGNLRRSWVSGRRALSVAQLMGLNRSSNQARYKVLDSQTRFNTQLMWFRIVFLDRYLCLMLGLSQGCLDCSMASDVMLENDTPMGRLERIHCVVASKILERNESKTISHDMDLTRTLDLKLQKAARSLPSKWWFAPPLDNTLTDTQTLFWNSRRLFAQLLHYNLLNQLHLPYMLRSSSAERRYEYSRITCVNASREVLSRFITLRSFSRIAYSCRTVDFLALMAAMTLLLAHLDSNSSGPENLLAHQYHSDRAMIEQVQENMEEVNRLSSDALSAQSADLLRRLLTIEIDAEDGYPHSAKRVSVQEAGTDMTLPIPDDDAAVSVHIPYFGIIKIAREGMSKEVPKPPAPKINDPVSSEGACTSSFTRTEPQRELQMPQSGTRDFPNSEAFRTANTGYGHVAVPPMRPNVCQTTQVQLGTLPSPITDSSSDAAPFASQIQNDPFFQYEEYPGMAAGGEDWPLQGVDMAFFETLAGNGWNENAELITVGDMSMNNNQ